MEGERHETTVTVTPLDAPPSDVPKKVRESKLPPRWWKLTIAGIGLAPIEFLISTAIHEGSHAVVASANGATVTGYHPYPHKEPGMPFRFGDVHWTGTLTPGQRVLTLAAPMFLDSAVLGTYGGLLIGNALPQNRYAHMAMWVFAAGHWVDLANHVVARNEHTDTQRIERYFQEQHGLSETQSRLAVRGSQALVLAAGGYFLYKGLRQIFKDTAQPLYDSMDLDGEYERKKAEENKKKKKKKKQNLFERHNLYISPSGDQYGLGFVLGGRF